MIYLTIIAVIVISETLIKNYIEKHKSMNKEEQILGGKIILSRHHNHGMCLNFLEAKKETVKTLSGGLLGFLLLLFALFLPKKGNKLFKLGLSLVIGGAISNVSDRFIRGYVVDYFSFNCKCKKLKNIVFNLSDIFIFLGSALIFVASLFTSEGKSGIDKTIK